MRLIVFLVVWRALSDELYMRPISSIEFKSIQFSSILYQSPKGNFVAAVRIVIKYMLF